MHMYLTRAISKDFFLFTAELGLTGMTALSALPSLLILAGAVMHLTAGGLQTKVGVVISSRQPSMGVPGMVTPLLFYEGVLTC